MRGPTHTLILDSSTRSVREKEPVVLSHPICGNLFRQHSILKRPKSGPSRKKPSNQNSPTSPVCLCGLLTYSIRSQWPPELQFRTANLIMRLPFFKKTPSIFHRTRTKSKPLVCLVRPSQSGPNLPFWSNCHPTHPLDFSLCMLTSSHHTALASSD